MSLIQKSLALLACVLMTLAAILLRELIPPKRLYLDDALVQLYELSPPFQEGQLNIGNWLDEDNLYFECVSETTSGYNLQHICQVVFYFTDDFTQGQDFSDYDALIIDAQYEGDAQKLYLSFRNYNPDYSTPDDENSAKNLSGSLYTREFNAPVRIGLNEIAVSDWWLNQFILDRQYIAPEFTNITNLSINLGYLLEPGQSATLKIKQMYFVGEHLSKEALYFGIIIGWISVAIGFLLLELFIVLRRNRKYEAMVQSLSQDKQNLRELAIQYEQLSSIDELTQLLNRHGLHNQVAALESQARANNWAILLMDIDHFKRMNDKRGHTAGDSILQEIAKLLLSHLRPTDTVVRWGGEEFIILAPIAELGSAQALAEKLRHIIDHHTFCADKPIRVTASFGVTQWLPSETYTTAFERADQALYEAKNAGRNCCFARV